MCFGAEEPEQYTRQRAMRLWPRAMDFVYMHTLD